MVPRLRRPLLPRLRGEIIRRRLLCLHLVRLLHRRVQSLEPRRVPRPNRQLRRHLHHPRRLQQLQKPKSHLDPLRRPQTPGPRR